MIVQANCLSPLPLADASVDMCVTSPPYYALRDYGVPGQIGLEATPEEYICNMVSVFAEVRRVLKDDGTLWVNIGDSYAQATLRHRRDTITEHDERGNGGAYGYGVIDNKFSTVGNGTKEKDLLGIPWMLAFALRADGWYLRSDIIWAKPNPMPESVTDRPTKSHEYLFLLSKSARYYYDAEAIKEPNQGELPWGGRPDGKLNDERAQGRHGSNSIHQAMTREEKMKWYTNGRNRRSVWTVATEPFSGAHFATFPTALVEPCILAGSRKGGIVLDPFAGSGTTGAVARLHGRRFVGLDLSLTYLRDLALARAEGKTAAHLINALPLFQAVTP